MKESLKGNKKEQAVYRLISSHLEVGGPRGLKCSNGKHIIQSSLYSEDFSGIRKIWGEERISPDDSPLGAPELPAGFFYCGK